MFNISMQRTCAGGQLIRNYQHIGLEKFDGFTPDKNR